MRFRGEAHAPDDSGGDSHGLQQLQDIRLAHDRRRGRHLHLRLLQLGDRVGFGFSSSGGNVFDFFWTGTIPWILVIAALWSTFLLVQGTLKHDQLPWPLVLLAATGLASLLLLIRIVFNPIDGKDVIESAGGDVGRGIGMILSVLSGLVATAGAYLNFQASGGNAQGPHRHRQAQVELRERRRRRCSPPPPPPAPRPIRHLRQRRQRRLHRRPRRPRRPTDPTTIARTPTSGGDTARHGPTPESVAELQLVVRLRARRRSPPSTRRLRSG